MGGPSVSYNNWPQCDGLNPLKNLRELNFKHKNTEFNTIFCCLLVACYSSFKRDFTDSTIAGKKKPLQGF